MQLPSRVPEEGLSSQRPPILVTTSYADVGIGLLSSEHQFVVDWPRLQEKLNAAILRKDGMMYV